MYSVSLKVTLISTSEPLWQAVKSETEAMQVRLNLKANVNEALTDVAQTSVDAVLLESDDLSEVGELKSYLPHVPVILLHRHLDQQLGLAAIREGASEFLPIEEMGSGNLFRVLRYCVERAKVEQALEISRSQLLTSQKMEAIGRTVAGVAHDFRHFLQVVYGNCGLMKRLNSDPTMEEMIDEIRDAAERANLTIKHLLNFAQGSPVRETTIDLNRVILDLKSLCKALMQRGLSIDYSLCAQPLLVRMDSRIEQVLMNLVVNAADAVTGERGRILIESRLLRLERDYQGPEVQLRAGNYAIIEISDTGTGIEPEILDRIFEPFFTTKPREIGTGIGLSVVFTLVQDWHGKVVVASRPGVGTTFKLIFPSDRSVVVPKARSKKLGLTVNMREDDKVLQLLLRRDLSALGCEVVEVEEQDSTLTLRDGKASMGLWVSQISPSILPWDEGDLETRVGLSTPFSRQDLAETLARIRPGSDG